MSDTLKIQMTEEQAIQIHEDCIFGFGITSKQYFLNGLKENGYILKSELQQKVEDVEDYYLNIYPKLPYNDFNFKKDMINRLWITFQLLKQSHPEFKK